MYSLVSVHNSAALDSLIVTSRLKDILQIDIFFSKKDIKLAALPFKTVEPAMSDYHWST